MQRHGWRLLEESAFAGRLLARAQREENAAPEGLTALAVNLYCTIWHEACRGSGSRRSRAYQELAHYLCDRALHKYGDKEMAHEIAQDALLLIFEQVESCRNPGAFMAFALLKLWNAATSYFRQRDRDLERVEPLPSEQTPESGDSGDGAPELVDRSTPLPEQETVARELTTAVMGRVAELVAASPRAQKQLLAVVYKFVQGYSDEEIAQALATDVAGVHVLRSRGLSRMREDTVLRQLAQNYL